MHRPRVGNFQISEGSPEPNNFSKGISSHPNSVAGTPGKIHSQNIPKIKPKSRPKYDKGKLGSK